MALLGKEEIMIQSEKAFDRWKEIWHYNAKINAMHFRQEENVVNTGNSKQVLIFSFGPSLQKNINEVKEKGLQYDCDIICIDKALNTLLDNNIIPKYVVISDAQVNFEQYGNIDKKYVPQIKLLAAITANCKWAKHWYNNGGQTYYYVNKDHLRSHRIFDKYLQGENAAWTIPASSNVGNAAYVLAVLPLGYREVYLFGYDYSYNLIGDYYGAQKDKPIDTNLKVDKHRFYNHYTVIDINGDLTQVSHNMQFSAKWLISYAQEMQKHGVNTVNCTGAGILKINAQGRIIKEAA